MRGKKMPSEMSVPEKWKWHAEVYAFRRVFLGVPATLSTSPCDPDGKWFDPHAVDAAEQRLREKHRAETVMYERQRERDEIAKGWRNDQRTSRQIVDEWAQARGFTDFRGYVAHGGIDYADALVQVALSALAAGRMPGEPNAKFDPHAVAEALEVKAREYNPTAEQLAAGREQLIRNGLMEPEE